MPGVRFMTNQPIKHSTSFLLVIQCNLAIGKYLYAKLLWLENQLMIRFYPGMVDGIRQSLDVFIMACSCSPTTYLKIPVIATFPVWSVCARFISQLRNP